MVLQTALIKNVKPKFQLHKSFKYEQYNYNNTGDSIIPIWKSRTIVVVVITGAVCRSGTSERLRANASDNIPLLSK